MYQELIVTCWILLLCISWFFLKESLGQSKQTTMARICSQNPSNVWNVNKSAPSLGWGEEWWIRHCPRCCVLYFHSFLCKQDGTCWALLTRSVTFEIWKLLILLYANTCTSRNEMILHKSFWRKSAPIWIVLIPILYALEIFPHYKGAICNAQFTSDLILGHVGVCLRWNTGCSFLQQVNLYPMPLLRRAGDRIHSVGAVHFRPEGWWVSRCVCI